MLGAMKQRLASAMQPCPVPTPRRPGPGSDGTALRDPLRHAVAAADPCQPLSDARLAATLKTEGMPVARRTVATSREALRIPASHERVRIGQAGAPHRRRHPARGPQQKEVKMQIETYGQQMDVTPALRSYVETRFERLGRHFEGDCEIRVQLGLDKPAHKAEANVTLAGRKLHADATGQDMYAAIDLLVDKLDRQLIKHKEKQVDHHRGESLAKSGALD